MGEDAVFLFLARPAMAELSSMADVGPLLIEEKQMQMNPNENGAFERGARTDPELFSRVQSIETILPTLATRAQLEQLRGEMKEGLGAVRSEMHAMRADWKECLGEMRVEMHRTVNNARRWSIGIAISCFGLSATLMTAVMPLIVNHARA
jgi:hypothetical protein